MWLRVEALAWRGQDPGLTPITRRGTKGRKGGQYWNSVIFKKGKRLILALTKTPAICFPLSFMPSDLDKDRKTKAKV